MTIRVDELRVKDVMSPRPLCLARDLTVAEAIQVLVGRELHGAPIVDEDGDLVGVVSTTDLLTAVAPTFLPGEPLDVLALQELKQRFVHTLSERPPATIDERAPIGEASQLMVRERVHRLVVVGEGARIVGLISSIDLVRAVACLTAGECHRAE